MDQRKHWRRTEKNPHLWSPTLCSVLSLYLAGFPLSFCPLVVLPSCCLFPSRIVSAVVSAIAAVPPHPTRTFPSVFLKALSWWGILFHMSRNIWLELSRWTTHHVYCWNPIVLVCMHVAACVPMLVYLYACGHLHVYVRDVRVGPWQYYLQLYVPLPLDSHLCQLYSLY